MFVLELQQHFSQNKLLKKGLGDCIKNKILYFNTCTVLIKKISLDFLIKNNFLTSICQFVTYTCYDIY